MTTKMSQLEATIKLLQDTIKQQQEVINKLTTAQQPAVATTWSFGATPQPASFTALGAKPPATRSPSPPSSSPSSPMPETPKAKPSPAKIRRRAAVLDSDNEDERPMNVTSNEDARPPADDGINYGVRIRQINKRLDKHDREIRSLNEKVTRLDERVGRLEVRMEKGFAELRQEMSEMKQSFEELKQLIMGQAKFAGQGVQQQQQGAKPKHG